MPELNDKSQELMEKFPSTQAVVATTPVADTDPKALPFDKDYFERHKEELRRQTLVGRVALFVAIIGLLLVNIYYTNKNTTDLLENINWARMEEADNEVATHLRNLETRLAALEQQNQKLIQLLETRGQAPKAEPVEPAAPAAPATR